MKTNRQTKKISEVCILRPQKSEIKLAKDDLVSFVPMEDMKIFSKDLNLHTDRKLSEVRNGYTYFANEDVLLAKITPCFENGKLGIARGLKNGIGFGSSEYFVFRSKGEILPDYLYYILSSNNFRDQGIKLMSGAVGHKRVPKEYVENFKISFPPIPEQKRIVKILDQAFEKLEKAKQNTEKNLQNSKELFESYLNDIFSKPRKDWEEKTINQISQNLDSKRVPITKKDRNSGEYPYYGASGVVDYVSNYIFDDNLLLISEDGANLLDRNYPIAFSVDGKVWVNNHAHVVKFSEPNNQRFVEYYLNSIKLDQFVSGAAQPKLNQQKLNSIPIPWPQLQEQKQIVKKLDKLSEKTKKLESLYQQKLENIEELKKSILQKVFRGGL